MTETEFGKYRLVAELGHGGMADVYLAALRGPEGLGFSKLVVVKRLRANLVEDPEFVAMLIDEARIAARLNHPNVVQTIEVGQVDHHYFVAMEYLEGQPLHRVLTRAAKKEVKIPLAMHCAIAAEVLAGLHHAHELTDYDGTPLHVVHRDVSPHNVFVTFEGQVKLVDFGIAKAAGRVAETRMGVVKGKITYMAPEQASGIEVDRRADLFSVGVMLWEAATGKRMWANLQDIATMERLLSGKVPVSPKAVASDVPDAVDAICRRALAVKAADRYATAEEFRRDIETYLDELERESRRRMGGFRELGELVSELFDDKRKELRGVIEKQLGEQKLLPVTDATKINFPAPHESTTDSGDMPSATELGRQNGEDATVATLVTSKDDLVSARSSRVWVLMGVAALAAGGAWIGMRRMMPEPAPAMAPPPMPIVEASPSDSARPASGDLNVTLRASPVTAKFTIDDGEELPNPFVGTFPRDGKPHIIRATADRFETKTRTIVFDHDVVLDLALEQDPAIAASAAVRKGAGRPVPQPEPTASTGRKGASGKPQREIDTGDLW